MSVNKAILVGFLGADPDIKQFADGIIANVSIATNERWTDKQTGEKRESTEWHRVVFSGRLAEIVRDYLRKGSQIYVEGKIVTRKWTDKNDGIERYSTDIRATTLNMLSSSKDDGNTPRQAPQQTPQAVQQMAQSAYQQPPQFGATGQVNNQFNQQFAQQQPQFAQPQYQGQQGYPQPSPQTAMQRPVGQVNDSDIPF
ncbi:single-stranded DNA-binding protein [Moraxella sp. ZJ142]|uniref:single-stranded DNA-binding protein n=1 Tax=Moraxella marmotae TaxID=3344520 RepID=UPI0035D446BB